MTYRPSRSHLLRYLALLTMASTAIGCGSDTPAPPATTAETNTTQPAAPPVAPQPGQPAAPPVAPPVAQQPAQQPAQPAAPPVAQQLPVAAVPATPQPAAPVAIAMAPEAGYLTAQDSGAQINVRSAPSTSANTPHYGVYGDAVTLEQYVEGTDGYIWYNVRFDASGVTGWVRGDFVAFGLAPASAPANAPVSGMGIVQDIQFDPGMSSANLYGSVVRGTEDTYYIAASPGQWMTVSLAAEENNAVFQIYGEVEGTWSPLIGASPGEDATEWYDMLPGGGTGTFMIVVGPTRGNANYSLFVAIE